MSEKAVVEEVVVGELDFKVPNDEDSVVPESASSASVPVEDSNVEDSMDDATVATASDVTLETNGETESNESEFHPSSLDLDLDDIPVATTTPTASSSPSFDDDDSDLKPFLSSKRCFGKPIVIKPDFDAMGNIRAEHEIGGIVSSRRLRAKKLFAMGVLSDAFLEFFLHLATVNPNNLADLSILPPALFPFLAATNVDLNTITWGKLWSLLVPILVAQYGPLIHHVFRILNDPTDINSVHEYWEFYEPDLNDM